MVCEYLCDFCTNGITFVRFQLCLLGMNHLQSVEERMARGQQKIQSQQKAAEKAAKLKKAVRQWIIVCDAKATVLQCQMEPEREKHRET